MAAGKRRDVAAPGCSATSGGVPGLSAPGNPTYWANGAHAPNEHVRLADLRATTWLNYRMLMGLNR
jgi:acetylornithine deacetylase/succinyl-diaminopimelate desuccinylase-like protein